MVLKLVRGTSKEPQQSKQQKSREEYLVSCLHEEANDPRFTDWEKKFIASLARHVGLGRKLSEKQREIVERVWKK